MRLREEKTANREVRTKLVVTEVKLAYILHSFGNWQFWQISNGSRPSRVPCLTSGELLFCGSASLAIK